MEGIPGSGDLGTLYVKLTANSAELVKGMNQAKASVVEGTGTMVKAVGAIGAAVVAAAAVISLKLTKSAIDAADEMGKMAQKAGQTVEAFSSLAYSAGLADMSTQELVQSTKFLAKWMEENGTHSDNLTESIIQQADAFANTKDEATKLRMAYERFGRAGAEMLPFLNQGSKAIREQMDEARIFGAVIGKEFSNNAQTFNDNLKRIHTMFSGIFNMVAEQLLPKLIELTEEFIRWAKETDAARVAADAILASFKTLSDIIDIFRLGLLTIWTVLRSISTIIATNVTVSLEAFRNGIDAVIQLVGVWWTTLKNLMAGLADMSTLIGKVGGVMQALLSRDFAAVALGVQDIGKTVAKGWEDISTAISTGVDASGKIITDSVSKTGEMVVGLTTSAVDDIMTQWGEWVDKGAKIMEPIKTAAKGTADVVEKATQDIEGNSQKMQAALAALGGPKNRMESIGLTPQMARELGVSGGTMEQLKGMSKPLAGTGDDPLQAQAMQFASEEQMLKDRLAVLQDVGTQEVKLTEEMQKRKEETIMAFNERLKKLQMAQAVLVLNTSSKMFDDLASIAEAFGGKQSAAYKAMFAASKAFAVAEATVKIAQGIAAAAANPWPLNLMAMGSVIAATASIVSSIQAVKLEFGGAKEAGGDVSRGKAFLVGEKGPELFVPSRGGSIVPNDVLGGGSGGGVRVIINNYTDAKPEVKERNEGNEKVIEIMIRRVKNEIGSEIRDGRGDVTKSMESTFGLKRGKG